MAIDTVNSATLYLGSPIGVLKSGDAGQTWVVANTGLALAGTASNAVNSLVPDPSNPAAIYAATAQRIFKSADGAATWQP